MLLIYYYFTCLERAFDQSFSFHDVSWLCSANKRRSCFGGRDFLFSSNA